MKTKEEILKAQTAREVLEWIKANPAAFDEEVGQYFNKLSQKEFRERIGPDYDPDIHYDFNIRRKKETDD